MEEDTNEDTFYDSDSDEDADYAEDLKEYDAMVTESDERKGNCSKCLIGHMVETRSADGEWEGAECDTCGYSI